jgi:O-antigen ligase
MSKNIAAREQPIVADVRSLSITARQVGLFALAAMLVSVQFSIAAAQTFFAIAGLAAAVIFAVERRWPTAPAWASPLVLFAAWTLGSAGMSMNPAGSLEDCKQLVLLLLIPVAYELGRYDRPALLTNVVLTAGAVSAVIGISQYSLLHFDNLGQRPRSTLGMYMTFAGLMMLTANLAAARLLFGKRDRIWPALTISPLLVALLLSFTRSAWIGAASGIGVQLFRRDFRLVAVLPLIVALVLAFAPVELTRRAYSIFDRNDATGRDRVAMLVAGVEIVRDYPLFGVGPDMIEHVYPTYRRPTAVLPTTPHLHNVPLQIAAERGLPALALWIWFLALLVVGLTNIFKRRSGKVLAAGGLGVVASMLTAGLFEYNFGDSEFQMLFLVLITLPFAADREGGLP